MLIKVPVTNPVGVDLFSYVTNTFFCSNEFVWLLSFFCFYLQLNQVSPQQIDVIEHHYKVYERLQKIKAETEEVSANKQKYELVKIPQQDATILYSYKAWWRSCLAVIQRSAD